MQIMTAFCSLAIALRGQFHKPFAELAPDIQQRIQEDYFPWPWESKSPRERCHVAKQWDHENDPALREFREGVEALTNPESPAYSEEAKRRLRGDYLPEPRNVKPKAVVLPPMEWEEPQPLVVPLHVFGAPLETNSAATNAANSVRSTARTKRKRNDLLSSLIKTAQTACSEPLLPPSEHSSQTLQ
jgi:hypothetical protein